MERKSQSDHYVVLVADGDLDRARPLAYPMTPQNGFTLKRWPNLSRCTGARIDAFIGLSHQNIG